MRVETFCRRALFGSIGLVDCHRNWNIPNRAGKKWNCCFSKSLYKDRNLVERFFNKIKYFRRIATRYDKLGSTYLAMVKLAAIRIWLRFNESTA